MSGSLKMRPCLPKTIPRTSFKSSSANADISAGDTLWPAKSKVSQVLTVAYSSCALATEKADSITSSSNGRHRREKPKGDFIEYLSDVTASCQLAHSTRGL